MRALTRLATLAVCAFLGCTEPAAAAMSSSPTTVAVKMFTSNKIESLPANDRGLREFEHFYHPAMLVESLGARPDTKASYTLSDTPAADFLVEGKILKSNGKVLQVAITVKRADGAKVFSKTYEVDHEDARERVIAAKMSGFYAGIAADVLSQINKTTVNIPEARARGYAGNPRLKPDASMLANSELAGQIERKDILAPMTSAVLPRAKIAQKVYFEWLGIVIPLQKDKSMNSYHSGLSTASVAVGVVYTGASIGSGIGAASQGNTALAQASSQRMAHGMRTVVDGAAGVEMARNRERAIRASLEAMKGEFTSGMPRQVTLKIYDKIMKLSGSQREMLEEFHKAVRQKLGGRG